MDKIQSVFHQSFIVINCIIIFFNQIPLINNQNTGATLFFNASSQFLILFSDSIKGIND